MNGTGPPTAYVCCFLHENANGSMSGFIDPSRKNRVIAAAAELWEFIDACLWHVELCLVPNNHRTRQKVLWKSSEQVDQSALLMPCVLCVFHYPIGWVIRRFVPFTHMHNPHNQMQEGLRVAYKGEQFRTGRTPPPHRSRKAQREKYMQHVPTDRPGWFWRQQHQQQPLQVLLIVPIGNAGPQTELIVTNGLVPVNCSSLVVALVLHM